jgi:hypothetical protein
VVNFTLRPSYSGKNTAVRAKLEDGQASEMALTLWVEKINRPPSPENSTVRTETMRSLILISTASLYSHITDPCFLFVSTLSLKSTVLLDVVPFSLVEVCRS